MPLLAVGDHVLQHFRHDGYKGGNATVLRHLLGREPTSFQQYIARGGKSAVPADPIPVSARQETQR
jgi:hypothetical protein